MKQRINNKIIKRCFIIFTLVLIFIKFNVAYYLVLHGCKAIEDATF